MPETREIRPLPDPTTLTTQQLRREIDLLESAVNTRFEGMDKAIQLLQQFSDKSPTTAVLEQQIAALAALGEEKFRGVEKQFTERDKRTEQLSLADKTAIAAALQAQKEAAGAQAETNSAATAKQELAFTKLLEQIQQTQSATNRATEDKVNALTGRLDRGEGAGSGRAAQVAVGNRSEDRSSLYITQAIAFGALAIGVVTFILSRTAH